METTKEGSQTLQLPMQQDLHREIHVQLQVQPQRTPVNVASCEDVGQIFSKPGFADWIK